MLKLPIVDYPHNKIADFVFFLNSSLGPAKNTTLNVPSEGQKNLSCMHHA